jgi:hypothetical protein
MPPDRRLVSANRGPASRCASSRLPSARRLGRRTSPPLGDEAHLPAVLVTDADPPDLRLAGPPVPRAVRGSPPHLHAMQLASSSPAHLIASLSDVVGEEEDVAGGFVEVVGAEALLDLVRKDLLSLVEFHHYLFDVAGGDPVRVERCSHPLLAGLCSQDPQFPLGFLNNFDTLASTPQTSELCGGQSRQTSDKDIPGALSTLTEQNQGAVPLDTREARGPRAALAAFSACRSTRPARPASHSSTAPVLARFEVLYDRGASRRGSARELAGWHYFGLGKASSKEAIR